MTSLRRHYDDTASQAVEQEMHDVKAALGDQFELVNDLLTDCDKRNTEQIHLFESLSKIHRDHYKECAGKGREAIFRLIYI